MDILGPCKQVRELASRDGRVREAFTGELY